MLWETIILAIAFIIFGFDIAWQFYVAGMYAPKKARKLILEDPQFQRLEHKLVTLESKLAISPRAPEVLLDKIEFLDHKLTELGNKSGYTDQLDSNIRGSIEQHITSLGEGLRSYINGAIGNLASGYYQESGLTETPPLAEDADKVDKELIKLKTMTVLQEQKAQFYYDILEPMVGQERADKMAYGLVMAPKWLTGVVKKKIQAMVKDYGG